MTTRLYRSTDTSAPVLTGEADKLNALLKACLVDGYGDKTAAGWTSPYYDDTTKTRVFRQAISGLYLQVQDNGQSTGGMREARIRGYESMSAFDTGTGPFPTVAQRTNGFCWRKSNTANTTARAWTLLADEKRLYLFVESGDTAGTTTTGMFGNIRSYKADDNWATAIAGRLTENSSTLSSTEEKTWYGALGLTTVTSHYLTRSYSGVGTSVAAGLHSDLVKGLGASAGFFGKGSMAYPTPVDGGLYLGKIWIHENAALRGDIPGIWTPLHNRPLAHGDTFSGVGSLTGRSFLALYVCDVGELILETSDTWDI